MFCNNQSTTPKKYSDSVLPYTDNNMYVSTSDVFEGVTCLPPHKYKRPDANLDESNINQTPWIPPQKITHLPPVVNNYYHKKNHLSVNKNEKVNLTGNVTRTGNLTGNILKYSEPVIILSRLNGGILQRQELSSSLRFLTQEGNLKNLRFISASQQTGNISFSDPLHLVHDLWEIEKLSLLKGKKYVNYNTTLEETTSHNNEPTTVFQLKNYQNLTDRSFVHYDIPVLLCLYNDNPSSYLKFDPPNGAIKFTSSPATSSPLIMTMD